MSTYLRRVYSSFTSHIIDIPPRLLALLLFLLLLAFPVTKPNINILLMLTAANVYAIFGASWDLLVGRCGQMSLGHALFFGIGAYSTAMLTLYLQWPMWVTIPVSILIGVLLAVAVGFPSIRVRGPYLALVTMALPLIATGVVLFFKDVTKGETGLSGLPSFFSFLPYQQGFIAEYYLTLLLLLASGIILYRIANSHTGLVFVSVLDDEVSSRASGINTTKYKLMAFVISAAFASMVGAVYAHIINYAGMGFLSLTMSFLPVIMTIWGGIGTIYGPIAAAYILQILEGYVLQEVVEISAHWKMLIYMVIIIVLIIKWPRGIARYVTDELEDFEKARDLDERGPKIWKKYKKKERK